MLDFLCLGAVGSDTMTGFEMLSNTVAMAKFWPPPAVRTPPEDAINVCFPGLQQDTFLNVGSGCCLLILLLLIAIIINNDEEKGGERERERKGGRGRNNKLCTNK